MKKSKLLTVVAIALSAQMFTAPAALAADELAQSICDYVADDNKNNLRKTLTDNRLRLRNVYDGISCGGLPLIRHAIKHNANDTGEFIVKQLPSSLVQQSGDSEWAQANGFANSPMLDVLKSRAHSAG